MSKQRMSILLMTLIMPFAFAHAQLEGTYEVIVKKQQEKKNSRWTLEEWLALKERNRWMDLWLAQNSHSSFYEFFLEGRALNYGQYDSSTPEKVTNQNAYGGTFAAYAGVVGLRGGYEVLAENQSNWLGSFNIRLFGRALQDTHINLEYGLAGSALNDNDVQADFQNQFGRVSTNIYLTRSFGLEGEYSKLLPASNSSHRTFQGESSKAGIFIDFSFFRVFGNWRKDFQHIEGAGLPPIEKFKEGFGGGIRLYF